MPDRLPRHDPRSAHTRRQRGARKILRHPVLELAPPMSSLTARMRTLLVSVLALTLCGVPVAADAKQKNAGDADRDHLPDTWERQMGLSTQKKDARLDPDKDGLINLGEFQAQTNPHKTDTDRDGLLDADEDPDRDKVDNLNETLQKTDPRKRDTDRDGTPDGKEDTDRDGLNNAAEDATANDPTDRDTDNDGLDDGDEGAGKIASFDGTTLVVKVFGGATLRGIVDEATSISCDGENAWSGEGDCTTADLHTGVIVRGGSVSSDEDGTYFDEVELVV